MTLKNDRRKVARALRRTLGMPFIMAKKVAKAYVNDGMWGLQYNDSLKAASIAVNSGYCPCCGPSQYNCTWEGFEFSWDIYEREIWNDKGSVDLKKLRL
jgi:hypothetical protein